MSSVGTELRLHLSRGLRTFVCRPHSRTLPSNSAFSPNPVQAAGVNTTQMIFPEIIRVIAFVFVFYIKLCLLDPESVLRTKLGCVKLKIWEKQTMEAGSLVMEKSQL